MLRLYICSFCVSCLRNVLKLKTHPSLRKGGLNDIHDIEDLVGLGHKVKGAKPTCVFLGHCDDRITLKLQQNPYLLPNSVFLSTNLETCTSKIFVNVLCHGLASKAKAEAASLLRSSLYTAL